MEHRCPKCKGKMRYKRITISEFNQKFLVSILECMNCKFWYQAVELKIDGLLPFKNWDIAYDDKLFFLMSEKIRNNLDESGIPLTNVWDTYSCFEKDQFEDFLSKVDSFDKYILSFDS